MDELEKTTPDDFWRKAFDEASETPPPRVWDAIEHRLNESDKTRVLPLWGAGLASSRPLVWGMGIAASVALVLIGWWLMPASQKTESLSVAHQKVQNSQATLPVTSALPHSTANVQLPTGQSTVIATKPAERNATGPVVLPDQPSATATPAVQPIGSLAQRGGNPVEILPQNGRSQVSKVAPRGDLSSVNQYQVSTAFVPISSTLPDALSRQMNTNTLVAFEPVSGKTLRTDRFEQIHRIVWFRPTELPIALENSKSKRKTRDVWASASMLSGAFDPRVSLRATTYPMPVANSYVAFDQLRSTTQQVISSQPSFSMAYQASAGVQLSDRWSIESGVGYLLGRSTVETPAQLPVASFLVSISRNAASTQYTDALLNSIYRNSLAANAVPTTSITAYSSAQPVYNGQSRQVLTNDYQYVQVPVQVGYQLRPRKKLSLAVLGGLITNIFVKNTVDNEVVVTAKDGVYRPASLAAIVGARFRYRPSQQWSASVAGVYQSSLGLGTQADSQVQTRPTSAGMSFGVDYHF